MASVASGVETLPKISIAWVGCTNVTDRRQIDRRTEFSSQDRVCTPCSAVKLNINSKSCTTITTDIQNVRHLQRQRNFGSKTSEVQIVLVRSSWVYLGCYFRCGKSEVDLSGFARKFYGAFNNIVNAHFYRKCLPVSVLMDGRILSWRKMFYHSMQFCSVHACKRM